MNNKSCVVYRVSRPLRAAPTGEAFAQCYIEVVHIAAALERLGVLLASLPGIAIHRGMREREG